MGVYEPTSPMDFVTSVRWSHAASIETLVTIQLSSGEAEASESDAFGLMPPKIIMRDVNSPPGAVAKAFSNLCNFSFTKSRVWPGARPKRVITLCRPTLPPSLRIRRGGLGGLGGLGGTGFHCPGTKT